MNKMIVIKGAVLTSILALMLTLAAAYTKYAVTPAPVAYGALAGPDIPYNYISVGGVARYYLSAPMTATSSAVCTFPNPTSGTTTVVGLGWSVSNLGQIPSGQTMDVSTTTTAGADASSSPTFIHAMAVSTSTVGWTPGITSATSTGSGWPFIGVNPVNGSSDAILAPNQSVSFRVATATPGTFSTYYTGTCHVILEAN